MAKVKSKKVNPVFILVSAFQNYRANGIPELATDEGARAIKGTGGDGVKALEMLFTWDNKIHRYLIQYDFSMFGELKIKGFYSGDGEYCLMPGNHFRNHLGKRDNPEDYIIFKADWKRDSYTQIRIDPDNIPIYC